MTTTEPAEPAELSVGDFLGQIAQLATNDEDGNPVAIAAGTFAIYPMPDGGIMFVTNVDGGPFDGTKHHRLKPAMIRAVSVLAGGGSKLSALKALAGKGARE